MFTLTLDERERRWKKIRKAMEKRGLECLIVWGSYGEHRDLNANLQYLIKVGTQGYLLFPLEHEPTLYTFEGGLEPTCWVADWRGGMPLYSKAISERLKELHLESASIGIVGLSGYWGEMGFPYAAYKSLTSNFPAANFKDATDIVEEARRIKSAEEVRCLELACEIVDKAIRAIVDTAKVGVKEYEIRAKMMDTMFRNGSEPASMILYFQGKELVHAGQSGCYYEPPSPKVLEHGDVILTEFDATYLGYKAQYNQPFSVGEPNKEWSKIFSVALEAFGNGLKTLRPGITTGELDEALLSPIKEAGYTYTNPTFHGLGLGLEEPIASFPGQPTYKPDTSLKIEAGMVFELEPQAVTLDRKKGVHVGTAVLVTETGCRVLSKTWKPEFKII